MHDEGMDQADLKKWHAPLLPKTGLRRSNFISNPRFARKWVEAVVRGSLVGLMLSKRPACASNRTVERRAPRIAASRGYLGQWIPRRWRADPSDAVPDRFSKKLFWTRVTQRRLI